MRHLIYGMGLALSFILGAALRPPGRPILTVEPQQPYEPLYYHLKSESDAPVLVLVQNSAAANYEKSH